MSPIDLRSDTVTRPTDEMRRAMAAAEVGDDVFGDDPTVLALEERAAELLGKEAGLFVTSGTQGNLVAQLAHLARGQETIAGRSGHMVDGRGRRVTRSSSGRASPSSPSGPTGRWTRPRSRRPSAIRATSTSRSPGSSRSRTPTPTRWASRCPSAYTAEVAAIAHRHGVPLHVDGARFFNAVVALGVRPVDLAGPADTVTFCLSKGLACPVGSLVVGSRETIWRARRGRKLVGGGLRQVGILAAAGLVALRDGPAGMIERLAEDHANARRLAEGLAAMDGIVSAGGIAQPEPGPLDPGRVRTDFVIFRVERSRAAFLDGPASAERPDGGLSPWSGPRRHPSRRERGRHRDRPGRRRPPSCARRARPPPGRTDGRPPGRPARRTP